MKFGRGKAGLRSEFRPQFFLFLHGLLYNVLLSTDYIHYSVWEGVSRYTDSIHFVALL